jgi:hypothetical protein
VRERGGIAGDAICYAELPIEARPGANERVAARAIERIELSIALPIAAITMVPGESVETRRLRGIVRR